MSGKSEERLKLILIPMKISDYIFTYSDIRELLKNMTPRDWMGVGILLVPLVAGSFVFGIEGGIFLTFAFVLFYWKVDSRFSIKCAIPCMIIIPVILIISNHSFTITTDWAERVAVWAFYFLSIGVIKQIWEYRLELSEKHNDKV